jgi:hypothetical protein
MVVPVLLLTLGAAAVLIGSRRKHSRHAPAMAGSHSPVAFQHLQLYQGGVIGQDALRNAKAELEEVLHQGGVRAAENALAPGLDYVVKVRALSEIGTEEAGRVLERQLARRIASDPVEQAWYWIDLAQALRGLNRSDCLPVLFRCGDKAMETPLGYLFAAEVTAFPLFADALHDPLTSLGQSAIRVLRAALEGMRKGYVPVTLYADAQIGEILSRLAETCPDVADARLTRIFIEALRHARRSYASSPELRDDPVRRQAIRWQVSQLRDAEPILREYLHNIALDLAGRLPCANEREQAEILSIIAELRADAGTVVIDLLADAEFGPRAAAIECLQFSDHPEAAWRLVERGRAAIAGPERRSAWWKKRKSKHPAAKAEMLAILKALRGHPGEDAESVLREFARHPKSVFRAAAIRSLGWWEPIDRADVIHLLHAARLDSHPEIRMAAIAALARLGECAAIHLVQEGLASGHVDSIHQTIDLVATEGLTWLWPDLDVLTESDHPAVAHHAWEAIEELRESILGPLN